MNEDFKKMNEKIKSLQSWVIMLGILLVCCIVYIVFLSQSVHSNTEYISYILEEIGSNVRISFAHSF